MRALFQVLCASIQFLPGDELHVAAWTESDARRGFGKGWQPIRDWRGRRRNMPNAGAALAAGRCHEASGRIEARIFNKAEAVEPFGQRRAGSSIPDTRPPVPASCH